MELKRKSVNSVVIVVLLMISISLFQINYTHATSYITDQDKVYVSYYGDKTVISSKYGAKYLWVIFSKCGPNKIFSISGLYLSTIKKPDLTKKYTKMVSSCSDWIGPYVVRKLQSDSLSSPQFTGGWHSLSNKNVLVESANTESVDIYDNINMKIQKVGYEGVADKIRISVINYIKAYNSGDDFEIKELVDYKITPDKIDVQVEITALDDVSITRYYGLQSLNYYWKGNVEYTGEINTSMPSNLPSDSGKKEENPNVNAIVLNAADNKEYLEVGLNRNIGLGSMEYVSNDKPCAFTANYGKSYFNLINGIDLVLNKGESIAWSGYYKFGIR